MNRGTYHLLERHMLDCMRDAAHDKEHIYRVLYAAVDIAQTEPDVDYDVLVSACLLHDIGREKQYRDPAVSHAEAGAGMAYSYLIEGGFSEKFAAHVRDCIHTHSYRIQRPPESIEAKILFDADKLDVTGAIGIARTLLYQGHEGEPLYNLGPDGEILDGTSEEQPSFFQEYHHKLVKIYSGFYTRRAKELAGKRQKEAESFVQCLWDQVTENRKGCQRLLDLLEDERQK